jgi:DUF3108-like
MKKIIVLLAVSFLTSISFAQNCESYFPQEINKKYEYTDYDKKDKEIGTTVKTVIAKNEIPGGVEITIKEEDFSKDVDTATSIEYTIKCENGIMSMDMESIMMSQDQMQAYEGMETRVDADDLTIPTDAKAGEELAGGKVIAEVYNEGMMVMSMTFTILDRKVDAIESLTTLAGTFECIKITSHVEIRMIVGFKMTITEWHAKGVGVVKSIAYSKNGKKISSTVLTNIQ